MADEEFDFTELAERLRGPGGAELAAQGLARLDQLQAEIATRLARGLSPDEYEANRRLSEALAAARRVMLGFSSLLRSETGGRDASPDMGE